jgi:hypothetical protein
VSSKEDLKKALDAVEQHLKDRLGADPMLRRYDKEGRAISLGTWTVLFEDNDYRVVKVTDTQEDHTVSTVWIGMASGQGPSGPVIFETMVFDHEGKALEVYKYATEDEARRNHTYLVDLHGGLKRRSQNTIRHRNRMRAITEEQDD